MRLKKVSDRVDAWLTLNDGELLSKGQWKGMAAQIRVSAEALYRELSTRDSITDSIRMAAQTTHQHDLSNESCNGD